MRVKNLTFTDTDIHFELQKRKITLREITRIDTNNLLEELRDQPGLFSYWAVIVEHAASELRVAENYIKC